MGPDQGRPGRKRLLARPTTPLSFFTGVPVCHRIITEERIEKMRHFRDLTGETGMAVKKGVGLFTGAFMKRFPLCKSRSVSTPTRSS
jgi:hypothetical protein